MYILRGFCGVSDVIHDVHTMADGRWISMMRGMGWVGGLFVGFVLWDDA